MNYWRLKDSIILPTLKGGDPTRVHNVSERKTILGDPGATSREDAIFLGESLLQELNIASSRLVAPGSPRMEENKHMNKSEHTDQKIRKNRRKRAAENTQWQTP